MRVGLYARVSTQEQAREGYSIDEQQTRLRAYAEAMHWDIVRVYVDGGYSGAKLERPDLQMMIRDIRDHKLDKILVYKLDRLSRSQKHTLYLIEDVILASGADLVSLSENFDTSTPFGRATIGILSVFAQLEREQIRERTSIGRQGRAKNGLWIGSGSEPIGYRYRDGKLQIEPYEAEQIREIFRLYTSGSTGNEIVKQLRAQGLRHQHGEWTYRRLRAVLANRTYLGEVSFAGERFPGAHEAIIDQDTFDLAQKIAATRRETFGEGSGFRRSSLLGGLVWCSICGARLGTWSSGRYAYYVCHSVRHTAPSMVRDLSCTGRYWRREELDAIVLEQIRQLAADPRKVIAPPERKQPEDRSAAMSAEIRRLSGQISRLMDLYSVGGIPLEDLQAKIAPLSERRERLQTDLTAQTGKDTSLSIKTAQRTAGALMAMLPDAPYEKKRLAIEALIKRIDVGRDTVQISWRIS